MRCFTHQDKEAVGICKACNKGICVDCAADLGHSLSCKSSSCEEKSHLMDSTLKRSMAILRGSKRFASVTPIYCAVMGLAFIYFGIEVYPGFNFLSAIGIGLLFFAIIYFFVVRKMVPNLENKAP